jgi:hypothetical protein
MTSTDGEASDGPASLRDGPIADGWSQDRMPPLCADEERALDAEKQLQPLSAGYSAALYTTRPRYGPAEAFEAFYDLRGPDGQPAVNHLLMSLVEGDVLQPPPQQIGFTGRPDLPAGTYEALILAPAQWNTVTIIVSDPLAAVPIDGGTLGTASSLNVDHTAPGHIGPHYVLWQATPTLELIADLAAPAQVTVQLELTDPAGVWLGGFDATFAWTPQNPQLSIFLPSDLAARAQQGGLVLARAALLVDGACSDLVREVQPLAVETAPMPP